MERANETKITARHLARAKEIAAYAIPIFDLAKICVEYDPPLIKCALIRDHKLIGLFEAPTETDVMRYMLVRMSAYFDEIFLWKPSEFFEIHDYVCKLVRLNDQETLAISDELSKAQKISDMRSRIESILRYAFRDNVDFAVAMLIQKEWNSKTKNLVEIMSPLEIRKVWDGCLSRGYRIQQIDDLSFEQIC